ncbi:unnamed protein product [Ixodes hexagonus]
MWGRNFAYLTTISTQRKYRLASWLHYHRRIFVVSVAAVVLIGTFSVIRKQALELELELDTQWDGQVEDFEHLKDGTYIVPNIVHFIRLGNAPLQFVEVVCIRAAWLQQRPDHLMIHCDPCNATVNSPLWYIIKDIPGLLLEPTERPTEIFGVKFSSLQHTSDVVRALVLMKHGGIYLDSDAYLVRSLDPYRIYELSIGWPPGELVGTQVIVAHKDARYLRLWYESYRRYRPGLWYWNAGGLPTKKFLSVRPDLVNRVQHDFGVLEDVVPTLYSECNNRWRNFSAFHLFFRHRLRIVPWEFLKHWSVTLESVPNYDRNFGQMARLVLSGSTRLGASEIRSVDWFSTNALDYSKHSCS